MRSNIAIGVLELSWTADAGDDKGRELLRLLSGEVA